jgi:hypothetical protein
MFSILSSADNNAAVKVVGGTESKGIISCHHHNTVATHCSPTKSSSCSANTTIQTPLSGTSSILKIPVQQQPAF